MTRGLWPLTLVICLALCGCGEQQQQRVSIPLYIAGTTLNKPVEAKGGVRLNISRAELAFGALYLCAGVSAGDLCEAARLEWLGSALIDTLDGDPREVGALTGVTGPVRSWMYDLGLSSQLTTEDPVVLEAAERLGGYSFVLEGEATLEGVSAPFYAKVKVQQNDETELGVPVIRKSSAERFEYVITEGERGLLLRFDPREWLEGLDLRPQLLAESCTGEPAGGEPAGGEPTGGEPAGGECEGASEEGEALELAAPSEAYRALRNALFTRGRPSFTWGVEL